MTNEDTINYQDLTDSAQAAIERQANDSRSETWFARPHGRGYSVVAIEDQLVGLAHAQGSLRGWLRVLMLTEQKES